MSVVNLNKARKAKAKTDARAVADENAVRFGRSKAQKVAEAAETAKAKARLDGLKRD